MVVRHIVAVALLAAFASAPVLAQDAAPVAAPAPVAKPAKEKRTCRTESVIGSNLAESTCHTKAEWDAIDHANQDNARNVMSHIPPR
ncbi:hypothetical protein DMC47_34885 [Nostoc sp. 3335mG]|nr:hypothetical protein DMC47_34885 [Nostoc sp. 3335mG]